MARPAYPQPHDFVKLEIERDLLAGFRKEAAARGTNAPALIRDLLDRIVADRLCNAILDDQSTTD